MINYPYNPYLQPQAQQRFMNVSALKTYAVSNIAEANATPVENYEPVFFYNKAENVIYKKQIDGTGAAPIQTFKLDLNPVKEEKGINSYENDFKAINDRLDGIEKLLKDKKGILNDTTTANDDKQNYQLQSASTSTL